MKNRIFTRLLHDTLLLVFLLVLSIGKLNCQVEKNMLVTQLQNIISQQPADTILADHIRKFLAEYNTAELISGNPASDSYASFKAIAGMVDLGSFKSGSKVRFLRSIDRAAKSSDAIINRSEYANLQVFIVPHSHADLSWPDTPEVCTNLNVQAISQSISILKNLPDFRFSEEDVFVLQEFLRRYPEQKEVVNDLLRKNILECGSFYMGPSEALLGGEGLIRNLYFGKRWLKDTFGINSEFAWNVDEPGHTLQMPQILAKAGIKNFVIWKVLVRPENNLNVSGYAGPSIFRWQSPDGSKIMVTHCPFGYGAGGMLRTKNYDVAEGRFRNFVQQEAGQVKKWNLPPVILMADGSDCTIPDEMVGINARSWNLNFTSPKVKLASLNDYFAKVENEVTQGKSEIKTIEGEIPCWWDGTQSVENDAFMLSRHAENLVTASEKFSSLGDLLKLGYDYPKEAINSVWQGKLWVHEHNWGGHNGIISDAVKLARARDSYRLADDLLSGTMDALVSHIKCSSRGIPLIVFNSLAWERTDIVERTVTLPVTGVQSVHLVDIDGKEVPLQTEIQAQNADGSIAQARIVFEATVPSLGYSTYYLLQGVENKGNTISATSSALENSYYKIGIDPSRGGITSIFDKLNNRELLNTGKYQGNELIALQNLGVDEAEEFTDKMWHMNEKPVTAILKESGPVRATIEIKGSLLNSGITQEISIYRTLPYINLSTELDWDGQKEIQVNVTFPFNISDGKLTYDVPFGAVQYGKENPYAVACHPTVRAAGNWIDLSGGQMGVTLATEVTPFDTKDRTDPRFHDARVIKGELEPEHFSLFYKGSYKPFERIALEDPLLLNTDFVIQPVLLRSIFSCGDKNLYFTQAGVHPYRFAVLSHKGSLVQHDAVRFGLEHNSPLIVRQGQSIRGDLPDSNSFLNVSAPNVVITILKKAEDSNGLVLRCYETDGADSKVAIRCPKGVVKAVLTNIIEEDQKAIPVNAGGEIELSIGKYSIETVRLLYK